MRVVPATLEDVPGWLALAAEVEPLFGPMVKEPGFHDALTTQIARGGAFCVREDDGAPGSALLGGLLWAASDAGGEIAWLAVAVRAQRQGIARRLVDRALAHCPWPGKITLTTAAEGVPDGEAARRFYERVGFAPAERAVPNPAGHPCQVYRLTISEQPTARAVIRADGRFLLAQHHYMSPANLGKWSLLGGRIDPGDATPEATLRRELREELTAEVTCIAPVHVYVHKARLHHVFAVTLGGAPDLHVDPTEIAALGWFAYDEVCALRDAGKLFGPFIFAAIRDSRRAG